MPTLLRPKSRGFIKLKSVNPFDQPLIQPNYLEDPEDVATLVAGIKVALKMLDTEVFKKNKLSLITDDFFCGNFEPMSDDYFECFVRHWMTTVYHPSGTCKMGPKNDVTAVVDHELRTHGIPNLRIADASIMPTIVGANTYAPVLMIGEKAADLIIQAWKKSNEEINVKKSAKKEEL